MFAASSDEYRAGKEVETLSKLQEVQRENRYRPNKTMAYNHHGPTSQNQIQIQKERKSRQLPLPVLIFKKV